MKFWSSVAYQVTEVPPLKPESATHAVPRCRVKSVEFKGSISCGWCKGVTTKHYRGRFSSLKWTRNNCFEITCLQESHCPITWCLKLSQAISTAQIDGSPIPSKSKPTVKFPKILQNLHLGIWICLNAQVNVCSSRLYLAILACNPNWSPHPPTTQPSGPPANEVLKVQSPTTHLDHKGMRWPMSIWECNTDLPTCENIERRRM